METTFTEPEKAILQHFYEKLAPHFGITAMWPTLCLRSKKGDIILRLEKITTPYREKECYLCNAVDDLKPAKVVLTHSNGDKAEWNTYTCVDCYCPK